MTWQVTYRDKNGSRAYEYIEADSKNAVFAVLKEKGINAISVVESNSKVKRKQPKARKVSSFGIKMLYILAVGFLAASAIFLAVFIDWGEKDKSTNEEIKPTKLQKELSAVPKHIEAPREPKEAYIKPEEPKHIMVDGRKVYRSATNDVGKVVTNAFGKTMVIERVVTPSGPMKNGESLTPRRIFKYDSEVAIDTLMNMDVGYKSLMMLPANMDEDFKKALAEKIEILPEDSEDEIRRKNEMIELKKELGQRIAAGEKISQIAAETLAHYNKIANIRDTLLQEIIKSEDEGMSGDELEDLYEAANTMLKEYDALPIHSPKVRKAIIRERLERNKARRRQ